MNYGTVLSPALIILIGLVLVISSGCQPAPQSTPSPQSSGPPAPPPPPGVIAETSPPPPPPPIAGGNQTTSSVASIAAIPDDPVELTRLSLEALTEKVRLISSVHDLESAKAVSSTFPDLNTRHRLLSEKLGNRLLTDDVRQRIEAEFKQQQQELEKAWAKEYHRVAFIPGAWEHMHLELTPYADMTVLPEDAEGLEREAVRMLTQAIELSRQATDAEKALEISPRYRVATCRLSAVLTKLNVARGGTGAREAHSPQIRDLRQILDAERKRVSAFPGGHDALVYGELPRADAQHAASGIHSLTTTQPAETDQVLQDLRSGDVPRVRNAVVRLRGMEPGPGREAIGAEVIKFLDFEPVRGSAVEAIKHGWFGHDQIPQLREAMARLEDRGFRYSLAEGISRMNDLEPETIEFLATLFNESPGDAVRVLRNVGPAAEPAILRYADSPQVEVRKTVCELLRDIGTEASLATLQKLAQDRDRGVADKAREAIREIGKPVSQRPGLRDRQ